jgi:SAM-dependent methyltransferase
MELLKSVRLISNVLFFRLKYGDPGKVDRHWENYWKTIKSTGRGGQVLWDNEPERASAEDVPRLKPHFDLSLPLLDFGCGNGRQTRYLAKHFDRVIGTDVSASAIAKAKEETINQPNIEYHLLDALRPEQAKAFHDKFGDVNIYMRTVLHVVQRKDRLVFAQSLASSPSAPSTISGRCRATAPPVCPATCTTSSARARPRWGSIPRSGPTSIRTTAGSSSR